MLRKIGREIPTKGNPLYDGGTVAYRDYYKAKGVLQKFVHGKRYPEGTLVGRAFRDSRDQGHVAIVLANGNVLQSYDAGGGKPGVNSDVTLAASDAGGYYEWAVPVEGWIGPLGEAPQPDPEGGGKGDPLWGVDVASFQQGIDMHRVAREGYSFCVVKATEGPYRDGSGYLNPEYRRQFDGAREAGMIVGSYHFLVETPVKPQVDLFLRTIGDPRGQLIMVDYEAYAEPYAYLSPTEDTLREFVRELKKRVGRHPILLYSGQGYWEEHPANGPVGDMGVVTWDASYPYHPEAGLGSVLYHRALADGFGWGKAWGDQEPMIWQFSANGLVAGMQIDVNAFRGSRGELRALSAPAPTEPPAPQKPPEAPAWLQRVEALERAQAAIDERMTALEKGESEWPDVPVVVTPVEPTEPPEKEDPVSQSEPQLEPTYLKAIVAAAVPLIAAFASWMATGALNEEEFVVAATGLLTAVLVYLVPFYAPKSPGR